MVGFLLVDKPSGPTSHDVVDMIRKATGIRKVGHAGTLDPFATGLLIMAIGKATKKIQQFVGLDKTYEAELRLGATSDTMDRTGKITTTGSDPKVPRLAEVEKILEGFRGEIMQTPPMYSAKKIGGKKLYELARQGKTVERQARKIMIHGLTMLEYEWPTLKLRISVSSGTYIRSLAHDIGEALGCGAYLVELRRTAIAQYRIEEAIKTDKLDLKTISARIMEM